MKHYKPCCFSDLPPRAQLTVYHDTKQYAHRWSELFVRGWVAYTFGTRKFAMNREGRWFKAENVEPNGQA